jgi:hypothetical protein
MPYACNGREGGDTRTVHGGVFTRRESGPWEPTPLYGSTLISRILRVLALRKDDSGRLVAKTARSS